MMRKPRVFFIGAAALLAAASHVVAQDKPGQADSRQQVQEHDHGAEKTHFEKKTFGNVNEAWKFIVAQVAEAEKRLAANELEPIHQIGEQLEAAVHTLEEKSDMVTGEPKTKLAALCKQLDKAADELHHAGEEKNADGASLALKKIRGLLPAVESLYPAGALQ